MVSVHLCFRHVSPNLCNFQRKTRTFYADIGVIQLFSDNSDFFIFELWLTSRSTFAKCVKNCSAAIFPVSRLDNFFQHFSRIFIFLFTNFTLALAQSSNVPKNSWLISGGIIRVILSSVVSNSRKKNFKTPHEKKKKKLGTSNVGKREKKDDEQLKSGWEVKMWISEVYQIYTQFTALKTTTLLSSITGRSKKSFAI